MLLFVLMNLCLYFLFMYFAYDFPCTMLCIFFFFFQAEDGIRDIGVTGVQTCALPILTGLEIIDVRQCERWKL